MKTLSLCMIVKNEESVLRRCLNSIHHLVDEIVIVDTGSDDQTLEIAKEFTDKIFHFDWVDDFALARNYAFSKAKCDYVMWLDADDVLLEEDQIKLEKLRKNMNFGTAMVRYDMWGEDSVTMSFYRERIFDKTLNPTWEGFIHETVSIVGNIERLDFAITHMKGEKSNPKRNIEIFEKHMKNGAKLNARMKYYYARELFYNHRFQEAIEEFGDFIQKNEGWIEDKIESHILMSECYLKINRKKEALNILLESFILEIPRANVMCKIGNYFFEEKDYKTASYWYENTLMRQVHDERKGFVDKDLITYVPALQLCVCYYNLGNMNLAQHYNNLAGEFKPNSQVVKSNREFLSTNSL